MRNETLATGAAPAVAGSPPETRFARPSSPRSGAGGHRRRPAHDRSRRDDRERRVAAHPARSRLQRDRARVDRHRLLAGLRQSAVARRPAGRHLRPPPDLHDRHPALLGRLTGRRLRHLRVVAADGARRAGRRSGARGSYGPCPDRHDVPDGRPAQPGARRLGRHGRRRRRHRPAARRDPDDLRVVALGLLRQRAHRPDRGRAGPHRAAGRRPAAASPRHPRCRHQHGRPGAAGLRPDARRGRAGRRVSLG